MVSRLVCVQGAGEDGPVKRTYIVNGAHGYIAGLLWGKRRRLVTDVGVAKEIDLPTLGLVGNLLTSSLPLIPELYIIIVLRPGREGSRGRRLGRVTICRDRARDAVVVVRSGGN